ncbi:hypothetical protein B0H19DRAFT_1229860 [Mycena capillaripes]|nr:hypothetical protein B0H19DRAFT_1229860 [Mycena capillaripes]
MDDAAQPEGDLRFSPEQWNSGRRFIISTSIALAPRSLLEFGLGMDFRDLLWHKPIRRIPRETTRAHLLTKAVLVLVLYRRTPPSYRCEAREGPRVSRSRMVNSTDTNWQSGEDLLSSTSTTTTSTQRARRLRSSSRSLSFEIPHLGDWTVKDTSNLLNIKPARRANLLLPAIPTKDASLRRSIWQRHARVFAPSTSFAQQHAKTVHADRGKSPGIVDIVPRRERERTRVTWHPHTRLRAQGRAGHRAGYRALESPDGVLVDLGKPYALPHHTAILTVHKMYRAWVSTPESGRYSESHPCCIGEIIVPIQESSARAETIDSSLSRLALALGLRSSWGSCTDVSDPRRGPGCALRPCYVFIGASGLRDTRDDRIEQTDVRRAVVPPPLPAPWTPREETANLRKWFGRCWRVEIRENSNFSLWKLHTSRVDGTPLGAPTDFDARASCNSVQLTVLFLSGFSRTFELRLSCVRLLTVKMCLPVRFETTDPRNTYTRVACLVFGSCSSQKSSAFFLVTSMEAPCEGSGPQWSMKVADYLEDLYARADTEKAAAGEQLRLKEERIAWRKRKHADDEVETGRDDLARTTRVTRASVRGKGKAQTVNQLLRSPPKKIPEEALQRKDSTPIREFEYFGSEDKASATGFSLARSLATGSVFMFMFGLAGIDTNAQCQMFQSLTLPYLEELKLFPLNDTLPVWHQDHFLAFSIRSSLHSHLICLELRVLITDEDLLRCLSGLPQLRELVIETECKTRPDHISTTDTLLQGLTWKPYGGSLVPELKIFSLTSLRRFTDNAFWDFVSSRAVAGRREGNAPFEIVLERLSCDTLKLGPELIKRLCELMLPGELKPRDSPFPPWAFSARTFQS